MTDPKKPEDSSGEATTPEPEAPEAIEDAVFEDVAPDDEAAEATEDDSAAADTEMADEPGDSGDAEAEPADASDDSADQATTDESSAAEDAVEAEADTPAPDAGNMAAAAATGAAAASLAKAEPAPPPPPKPEREIVRETVVEKRGGVIPGIVGGVIGGLAFVFGAPYVLPPSMMPQPDLSAVESRLDTADAGISAAEGAAAETATGLASLGERLAALETSLTASDAALQEGQTAALATLQGAQAAISDVSGELEALMPRIDQLERRPIAESPDPTAVAAVQSYGREVEALRSAFDDRAAELDGMVQAQIARSEEILQEAIRRASEARAEAQAMAAAAAEEARQAAMVEAVGDIRSAIEAGQPFDDAIARLGDADVPAALADSAASGVDALPVLREAFPPLAREALDEARAEIAGEDPADRGFQFLQRQLGVRSLAPKEGDGADAVLSRAEAAVLEGRLEGAVEELAALPEPVRVVLDDWIARAEARAAAQDAVDMLADSLTTN